MKAFIKDIFSDRELNINVSWNLVSLAFVGIVGIAVNIIIAKWHGLEALGIFNQVYAYYIVCSQLTSSGIQLATLQKVGAHNDDSALQLKTVTQGLYTSTIVAIFMAILIAFVVLQLRQVNPASLVIRSFIYALPGLFFFSINKVFFAFYNGSRRMRIYASMQSLRALFMIGYVLLLIEHNPVYLSSIFSLCEGTLLLIFIIYFVIENHSQLILNIDIGMCKSMCYHGIKGFMGNAVGEINTRLDVVMLSWFVDSWLIGLYSFAAMFAEGFQLLITVFVNNINPLISRYYHNERSEFVDKVRRGIRKAYLGLGTVGVVATLAYPLMLIIFNMGSEYLASWLIFSIIMAGRILASGYLPYQMLLNQTGYPGYYSIYILSIFVMNIAGNLILIPLLGVYGAALGTAIAIAGQVAVFKVLTRRAIGVAI